jgi:hypothetical protein
MGVGIGNGKATLPLSCREGTLVGLKDGEDTGGEDIGG